MDLIKSIKPVLLVSSLSFLVACASSPTPTAETAAPALPDWVMNPVVENGIADTQCIKSGNKSITYLKGPATSLARAELAKQIGLRVKAMDKTYVRMQEAAGVDTSGQTFESVSKQVTDKNLNGSKVIQQGYVMMPEAGNHFCVMVAMDPAQTKTLFKDLIQESGSEVSPRSEEALYERFLAKKATEELEAELAKEE